MNMTRTELEHVADAIKHEHQAVLNQGRKTLEHARRVGELLASARHHISHGAWSKWLSENVPFSERSAGNYLRIFKHWDEVLAKSATVADLTVTGVLKGLGPLTTTDRAERALVEFELAAKQTCDVFAAPRVRGVSLEEMVAALRLCPPEMDNLEDMSERFLNALELVANEQIEPNLRSTVEEWGHRFRVALQRVEEQAESLHCFMAELTPGLQKNQQLAIQKLKDLEAARASSPRS